MMLIEVTQELKLLRFTEQIWIKIHLKKKLINNILHAIVNYSQNGYENWKEAWENRCMHMCMELEAVSNNQKDTQIGVFLWINEEGKMLLETSKELKAISSGECSIKGIY